MPSADRGVCAGGFGELREKVFFKIVNLIYKNLQCYLTIYRKSILQFLMRYVFWTA